MPGFLIDEDLPPSLASDLKASGYPAVHVQDLNMRGSPDTAVLSHAVQQRLTLITRDLDFASPERWRTVGHHGIVVVRIPSEISIKAVKKVVVDAIPKLSIDSLGGTLAIVEVHRIRIRRQ